jgi:PAS domain S-box-containing protein
MLEKILESKKKQLLIGIILCCLCLIVLFSTYSQDYLSNFIFISVVGIMIYLIYKSCFLGGGPSKQSSQLESVLNAIPGFVSWIDSEHHYLGVNKNLSDFFNLDPEDFIGKKLGTVTKDKNSILEEKIKELFSGVHEHIQLEISLVKDGTTFWRLLTLQKYNNGKNALLVSMDVTELKNAQIKIAEEEARSVHSGRLVALGEMVGTIAHEISNPLSVISITNSTLRRQIEKNNITEERLKVLADKTKTALDRITKIIHSIKNLVRDGTHDEMVDTSLDEIFSDVVLFISKKCEDNRIDFNIDRPVEKIILHCVPVQIGQIILILLNNAIDAISEGDFDGGGKWVQLKAVQTEKETLITVVDCGKGIDEKLSQKIFQSFFTTKGQGKGTGIGLNLALKLARSHGGDLVIKTDSSNTEFQLSIPHKA